MLNVLLRHERAVILGGLALAIALAWAWLLSGAGIEMDKMDMGGGQVMLMAPAWTAHYAALILLMWTVMMVAMMLPGASPAILLAAALNRQRGGNLTSIGLFVAGYLAVWTAFSAAATVMQWRLETTSLLNEAMASANTVLAAVLLAIAGVYQLVPWKQTCLRSCRSPADTLTRHWRPGSAGAFLGGVSHGLFCVGCCWALMLLLFVGGLMNPIWIGGLAVLVMIEKLSPIGPRSGQAVGVGLIVWSAWLLMRAPIG